MACPSSLIIKHCPPVDSDYNDPNGRNDTTNFKDLNGVWSFIRNNALYNKAKRFPSLASMSKTNDPNKVQSPLGAPQLVTQLDVLNSVGPNLTARSDTFVIRAYGEALDNAGNVIGKAWAEVVVQRSPNYLIPSPKGPGYEETNRRALAYRLNSAGDYDTLPVLEMYEKNRLPAAATQADKDAFKVNRLLGRRFQTTSLRWLSAEDI